MENISASSYAASVQTAPRGTVTTICVTSPASIEVEQRSHALHVRGPAEGERAVDRRVRLDAAREQERVVLEHAPRPE